MHLPLFATNQQSLCRYLPLMVINCRYLPANCRQRCLQEAPPKGYLTLVSRDNCIPCFRSDARIIYIDSSTARIIYIDIHWLPIRQLHRQLHRLVTLLHRYIDSCIDFHFCQILESTSRSHGLSVIFIVGASG
jgi:hypothetical protein